jgi:hypothetical protein
VAPDLVRPDLAEQLERVNNATSELRNQVQAMRRAAMFEKPAAGDRALEALTKVMLEQATLNRLLARIVSFPT